MTALFVNQLTVIDASYLHPEFGVVGESWLVDVILYGELNDQGMIFDFGHVKKQIKQTIDEHFDHKLIAPAPHIIHKQSGTQSQLTFKCKTGVVQYTGPSSALALIDSSSVDIISLETEISQKIKATLPSNVHSCEIKLRHEQINGAYYHYSHGLKKHDGACQRIAHGHRSKIEIYSEGERQPDIESTWAETFKHIYIGTRQDIDRNIEIDGIEHMKFAYTAQDGAFELTIPVSSCYLMDTDTTVENIAAHLYDEISKNSPQITNLKVVAYEGFQKGAIASK